MYILAFFSFSSNQNLANSEPDPISTSSEIGRGNLRGVLDELDTLGNVLLQATKFADQKSYSASGNDVHGTTTNSGSGGVTRREYGKGEKVEGKVKRTRGNSLGKTSGEELFLLGRERTDRVDLLHTRGLCVAHHKKHKGKISQTLLDLDTILDTTIVRNEGGGKMTTEKRRDSRPTRRC